MKNTTNLYLIRHGQSPKTDDNERSRGLTQSGIEASMKVRDLMIRKKIDTIFSSPYARARLTLQPLAESLDKQIMEYEDLKECVFTGDNITLADDKVYPLVERMFSQKDFANEGGESFNQCQTRAVKRLNHFLQDGEGENIAIGSHGFIMTALLNYFDEKYDYHFLRKMTKPDIYCLSFEKTKLLKIERLWEE